MKNRLDVNEAIKWIIIAILAILFYFATTGCNPVKKVLKSEEKMQQVVVEYRKKHPAKNDTFYIPGDTITNSYTVVDSIPLPYPVNHKYTERYYTDRIIKDTVKVIDRDLITAAFARVDTALNRLQAMTVDRNEWRSLARERLYIILLICAVIVGGGILYIVRVFKPSISIQRP